MRSPEELGEFESAGALLRWANEDLFELNRSVADYFAEENGEIFGDLDPDTGKIAVKVALTNRPPDLWRKLTYHFICDVRHAIDQAMFAAVSVLQGAPPSRDIYFPWSETPTDLTHRRQKIPSQLWPSLDRLQPYRGGNDYPGGDDTVYALRKLAGPNKHQVAVLPSARPTGYEVSGTAGIDQIWIPENPWDATKNEFTVMITEWCEKPNYEIKVSFNIAFGDVEGPVELTFRDLCNLSASLTDRPAIPSSSSETSTPSIAPYHL